MRRCFIIALSCIALVCPEAVRALPSRMVAEPDTLVKMETPAQSDSLAAEDSLSDEEILRLLSLPQGDTTKVKKPKDKGVDVSRLINAHRMKPRNDVPFESSPFMKNTFFSLGMVTQLLELDHHSAGLCGTLAFGKWLHEDHALRAQLCLGKRRDNYDFTPITGTQFNLSYIFNVSSFVYGFRTNRLFETYLVAGVGYANSHFPGNIESGRTMVSGHSFTFHVGAKLNVRIFKSFDFFIEPLLAGMTDGVTAYKETWRGVLPAFFGNVGLTYNVMQSYGKDSPALYPRNKGYFVSLMSGPHWQNSSLVYDIGLADCIGVNVGLGVGKNYTDYFAMRYAFSFSRNPWVEYLGETYPCNYFSLRAEGMLDVLSLVRYFKNHGKDVRHKFLSTSVLFGPEIGYMYKKDMKDVVQSLYLGVTAGAQVKFRLTPMIALFVEPRFSIVPYAASCAYGESINRYKNYYDGVMNFNAGIELSL